MYDVIIIGAGPAGIMASIKATKNGKRVLLIDKNSDIGFKLKLTGGGRCNITNLKSNNDFLKEIHNQDYFKDVLKQFGPKELYNYLKNKGVKLKEEDNNRIFSFDNKADTIIKALKEDLKCELKLNTTVLEIKTGSPKEVVTNHGSFMAKNLIIATGGKSYPQTGSTGDGYNFAKRIGHTITELVPAETYVITKDKYPLPGITLPVCAKYKDIISTGSLLFTHNGLSGPSIFKLSEYLFIDLKTNKEVEIHVDFLPKEDNLLNRMNSYNSKNEVITWLRELLPTKLSDHLLGDLKHIKIASISNKNKQLIIDNIKNYKIMVTRTGSVAESIVTGGGINLNEFNMQTLESKKEKGIYFVGEVLDLHGPMGGYNLTIAFSTGYVAGNNIE